MRCQVPFPVLKCEKSFASLTDDIEIPSELSPFVEQMISLGSYKIENEMLIEGLRLLKSREELRADINAGIQQLESGQGLDGEQVLARLEERARRLNAQKAP